MANEIVQAKESRLEILVNTDSIKRRFNEVLGKKAPQFMSSVISAYKSNDALSRCEPMSVITAAMQAATLDLPINQSLAQAYIIPYGGVAQFQIGWKGFVQLGQRTGQYKTMNATPVFEGQIKSQNTFTGDIEFQDAKTSDKKVGYLFYFKLVNGFEKYCYMTTEECEKHGKRYSQMFKQGKGQWADNFDAMALKTVVKLGLSKWGPLSTEMQKALLVDDGVIDVETNEVKYPDNPEPEVTEAKPTSSRLEKLVTDGAKTVITEKEIQDRLVNDWKTAINECTEPDKIDVLCVEACATTSKLTTENKSLINTHAKITKRNLAEKK